MLQPNKINEEYEKLKKEKAISENKKILSNIKWQKAVNDLNLAEGLLKISIDKKLKEFGKVKVRESLSKHTTFKIGGPADFLVVVDETDKLIELLK